MLRNHFATAALLCCIIGMQASAQTAKRRTPIIRQVDHILVESTDPKALFNFFEDALQLPPAWPISENQGSINAGISAGNVNLELFRYAERRENRISTFPEAHYSGLAFEPYPLADALQELQVRGIPYSPPEPYISSLPNGSRGVAWTTVGLPSFSRPEMSVFLYEYSPLFLRVEVRRMQLGNRLTLENGGPLGLLSISRIVISSTHIRKDEENWGVLLGGTKNSGSWNAGSGPEIHLVQGSQDRIQEIVFVVKSLERAKAFLKKNRFLGSVFHDGVSLSSAKVQGLHILVTEKQPEARSKKSR
jgi:hypothetical protein